MNQVLLVLRNDKMAQAIAGACHDRGAQAVRQDSLQAALEALSAQDGPPFGALILDLAEFGTKSDKKINQALSEISARAKVLGLGSGYDLRSVTSFYRSGLSDYLSLPLDPIELTRSLNKVLGSLAQAPEAPAGPARPPRPASPPPAGLGPLSSIVGQDPGLLEVFRIVEKVAATDSTVMVHGESGTGKELVARAIHQASPRSGRPMIPVNCGAIPEELLETELFGHEKGAFTNAIRDRVGRFEMADGGTIFLDEIGDMSPKLQVKLLRVIQEHEFERVGGDRTISVDIRIITATHVDLSQAVGDGRFREDLYYRLNVIPLTIPPLRDRPGDVPLLIDFFLGRLREARGSRVTGVSDEARALMSAYRWPGNVRELENLMERMVILADGPILTRHDLPQRLLLEVEGGPRPPAGPVPGPGPGPDFSRLAERLGPPPPPSPQAGGRLPPAELVSLDVDRDLLGLIGPLMEFPESGVDLLAAMGQFEDRLIRGALAASKGVKNQAARYLGLNRSTFFEKLKKRGLE
jgi:DNA-binding NtrC family response regulator